MSDPTWLVPGADAVILQPYVGGGLALPKAQPVKVARLTKRDVVLDNGERFNREHLHRRIGGDWGHEEHLVPPDDPRVEETRDLIRRRSTRAYAVATYDRWRRGQVSAAEVSAAFARLAEQETS